MLCAIVYFSSSVSVPGYQIILLFRDVLILIRGNSGVSVEFTVASLSQVVLQNTMDLFPFCISEDSPAFAFQLLIFRKTKRNLELTHVNCGVHNT